MSSGNLHMIRLTLRGTSVMRRGRAEQLPLHEVDTGYLAHCVLGKLFGDKAPRPFCVDHVAGGRLGLLAYSPCSADDLRDVARMCTDAEARASWDDARSKTLPATWSPGRRVAFETRVCPIVRMARDGQSHRKGAEVDAFLAACWRAGSETQVDRETVYGDWLRGRLEQAGAAVEGLSMIRFRRTRLLRRTHGAPRKARLCERPDATLCGEIRIEDSAKFTDLLRRGVGRHCGFGFGMLLLRRAR